MRRAAQFVSRRSAQQRCYRRSLHARSDASNPPVQITTLPNGIRVATEASPGHFSGVGLFVDAGSRYETPSTSGVSHFLDRLALKSTRTRSDLEMAEAIHSMGGQIQCSSSREAIMYQSSHFNKETPVALSIIADTVQNPAFLPEEIESQRDAARYEIREINAKPELVLPETLHEVAYGGKTLGNPILCPEDRIDQIDDAALRSFMEQWYRPERMVIAGAGMVHEELVELVHKHFSSLKGVPPPSVHPQPLQSSSRQNIVPPHLLPSASNPPSLYRSLSQAASSYLYPGATNNALATDSVLHHNTPTPAASYVGGHYFIHQPDAEFNHIYLAFEGPGVHSPDIYALATIQTLLGGGGSFSAGGPGKGMYSRLYTHILNHHPQVDHCEAFHHIYSDSSLVGLFASFVPASSPRHGNSPAQILPHLAHQISLLIHAPIGSAELQKAKNQLKSSLMMALESRAVEVEDLGRQILVHDRKIPVSEMCDRIDELSSDDLRNVATRYFGDEHAKCATVLVMGREDVGDWRGILRKYGVGGHK